MPAPRMPHLPWAPLGRVLAVFEVDRDAVGDSNVRISRLTGINGRQVGRYRRQGWLTINAAEQICDRIGVHPAGIWDGYGAAADQAMASQPPRRARHDRRTENQGANA